MSQSKSEVKLVNDDQLETIITNRYGANAALVTARHETIAEGKGFMSFVSKVTLEWSPEGEYQRFLIQNERKNWMLR